MRTHAINRPSREITGPVNSSASSEATIRRCPVVTSMTATDRATSATPRGEAQPAASFWPSALSDSVVSSRARPTSPVSGSQPPSRSRTASLSATGPRSWSQYRTG